MAHMYALRTQRNIMTKTLFQVIWCEFQKQSFCHYIPLCLQCIHVCIADTFTSHQIPWFRVFVMITLLCLPWQKPWIRVFGVKWMYQQCTHVCIANTAEYNDKNSVSGNMVWVECISNACMHALQTQQGYHDKNPESGYLLWSECISIQNKNPDSGELVLVERISNACMHALQMQQTMMMKTLNQGI